MDGTRVFFDRGLLVHDFTVVTQVDDGPVYDEFIEGTDSILGDHGGHPGYYIEDWCAEVVIPLLGD